jgi:TRAP-type C4-dicarboxylate transport system permease small subunit
MWPHERQLFNTIIITLLLLYFLMVGLMKADQWMEPLYPQWVPSLDAPRSLEKSFQAVSFMPLVLPSRP